MHNLFSRNLLICFYCVTNRDVNLILMEIWLTGGRKKRKKLIWKKLDALLSSMETSRNPMLNWSWMESILKEKTSLIMVGEIFYAKNFKMASKNSKTHDYYQLLIKRRNKGSLLCIPEIRCWERTRTKTPRPKLHNKSAILDCSSTDLVFSLSTR